MLRWLLLVALCALAAVTHGCSCVDPVTCPEAVVSPSPESCKLTGGGPGVCCPQGTATTDTRARSASDGGHGRWLMASFVGDSGGPRSPVDSDLRPLPAGARQFLNRFPLDTADQTVRRRRRPPGRPTLGQQSSLAPATDTAAQFTVLSSRQPAPPSGTTRLNGFNARTSVEAQRGAANSLRFLGQVLGGQSSTDAPSTSAADPFSTGPSRFFTPIKRPSPVPGCRPERPISCKASARYRTINGQCNNLWQTRWGSRLRGLRRIFDSTYDDGVFSARSRSVSGGLLPSARAVSSLTMSTESREQPYFTMAITTFGQFMDHDLSISPIFQLPKPGGGFSPIECCDGRRLPTRLRHPQCLPISVPADDPFYRRWGVRCMNFVRSVPAADPLCRQRPATQLNDLTSWMDLSQVYGSHDEQSRRLRAAGGRMRTSAGNLLPREPLTGNTCNSRVCFIAGDERVNENTLLTLFHTVFVREHNRVVSKLRRRHRSWSGERLFQRARRIVIAQWQHIAYHEWLPAIIGFRFARRWALTGFSDYSYSYTPALNPTVSTEFSTAGFRLHSMVQGVINLVSRIGTLERRLQLTDNFFRPDSLILSSMFTEMARGLTQQQPQSYDGRFSRAISGNLFKAGPFGLDLVALNIQRGRDHGIPTYATVASLCNDFTISGWHHFRRLMAASDVAKLRRVYSDEWRDVDLFVGINMERPAAEALVGPTARCLIAEQFLRARYADRFFYDRYGQPGSFRRSQLHEIKKATWARLLCDNVGAGFDAVQPLAFIKPINTFSLNPVVSCDSNRIGRVNLDKF